MDSIVARLERNLHSLCLPRNTRHEDFLIWHKYTLDPIFGMIGVYLTPPAESIHLGVILKSQSKIIISYNK